jgi:predicted nucleic acid-binding protein
MRKAFFDTNIIFYAYDSSEPAKQHRAQELLVDAIAGGTGYTSVQVLGEFFHATVLRKKVLTADAAEAIIQSLGGLHMLDVDFPMVRRAIDYHRRFQTSYWDSLILATAQRAGCAIIFSEDLNSAQNYDGVTAVNPFADGQLAG